jgi:hypothetical protein
VLWGRYRVIQSVIMAGLASRKNFVLGPCRAFGGILALAASAAAAPRGEALLPSATATDAKVTQPRPPGSAVASSLPLPRFFTVELTRAGELFADGKRLSSGSELVLEAQRSADTRAFAGAAVFGSVERHALRLRELSEALSRAGFVRVFSVGRDAPPELSAAAARPLPAAAERTAPAAGSGETAVGEEPGGVQVVTVGLHVGGAYKDEPSRRHLVGLFEKKFDDFQRCHLLASRHAQNASFGVDLLVPTQGGKATLRQTRTRLTGDGFQGCMQGVFQTIRFGPPPTGRPEIVSYSLLFKPATAR